MKLSKKALISMILAVIIVISLLYWANQKQVKESLIVSGTVQASEVQFGSRQGGRVIEVFVEEGQILKKNQIILSLDAKELKSQAEAIKATIQTQKDYIQELENGTRPDQIAAAKANYQRARADYQLTLHGNRVEDIKAAKAALESAKSEEERATQNARRRENLFKEQLISKDQLEIAQNQLTIVQKRLEEAKENYNKVSAGFRREEIERNLHSMEAQKANYLDLAKGTRPEKLAAERSRVRVYEAQLAELQTKLNELNVVSSCNCELSEFEIEPGTLLLPNQVLGTLIDLNDIWIDAYLPQEVYGRVWPGDKVEIKSLSYSNRKFLGRVKFVGLKAEFTPRNIQTIEGRKQEVFKVKVALSNEGKFFRPGMDLDMKFNFRRNEK